MTDLARLVRPFEAVVSPYHLTTREPASLVALQTAARATTLLLAPRQATADERTIRREAERSPAYRAYMRSWEWAMPLFDEGVLGTMDGGEDPVEDVRAACQTLCEDPVCAPLTPYLRPELFADDTAYLRAASADILKAGPDPGVSIPIAAGLDSFASERGMIVARSAPVSLVQRAEARLGTVVFRVSVPAVVQGSAERLLLVRALLGEVRVGLARAVAEAFERKDSVDVRLAARRYAEAFEAEREHICAPPGRDEENEVRVVIGEASLVGMELPVDAVYRSSAAAASGRPAGASRAGAGVRTVLIKSIGGR